MNPKKKEPKRIDSYSQYARYSAIVIQMLIVIFGGIWGGNQLDKLLNLKFPVFSLVFSLLAVITAIYIAIKDFLKHK